MSTSRPRQQRLPPEQRREQLLECAIIAAARTGLGRIAHAEVAREAGVARPTVFLYFPSRASLIGAIVEEVKRFYLEQGAAWHTAARAPREALLGHVRAFAESVESESAYAKIWLEWSTAVRNEDGIWDSFLDYQERMVGMVAQTLRRAQRLGEASAAVDVRDAARLVVSSAYAITQLCFTRSDRRSIERFVEHVVALALHP